MIEFLVIAWTFATPIAIWRLRRGISIRQIVDWIVLLCWPAILVLGIRDVPPGEPWRALVETPVGSLLFVPLLSVALKVIRRRRS